MSVPQLQQTNNCCQTKKAYTVTSLDKDKVGAITPICNTCFNIELKSKAYPDTLIKPYQRDISKIICNSCNEDVTKTLGCQKCHPKQFSNSKEDSS